MQSSTESYKIIQRRVLYKYRWHTHIFIQIPALSGGAVTEPGPLSTGRGGQTESNQIICHPGRHPHTQIIQTYRSRPVRRGTRWTMQRNMHDNRTWPGSQWKNALRQTRTDKWETTYIQTQHTDSIKLKGAKRRAKSEYPDSMHSTRLYPTWEGTTDYYQNQIFRCSDIIL